VVSVGESGTRASQDEGAEFEVLVGIDAPPDWLRPGMSADVEILVANVDSALAVPIQALVARSEETVAEWEARRARGETPESARKGKEDAEPEEREEKTAGEGEAGRLVTGIFAAQEGRARFQRIELGARGETYVEVRAGLDAEARVLTGPYKILRLLEDGELVKADRK
jgi:HlyD family secretion protein